MNDYQKLSDILDRQHTYRLFDSLVALVLAAGVVLAGFTVATKMPSAEAEVSVVATDATHDTAQLLATSPEYR